MLACRVAQPILRLSLLWQDFQQVRISVDRLGDILNAPAEPEHNPNRATLPPIKGRVEFDKASLAGEELRKAERRRQYQELRAPVDGVVQQLAVSTAGGVVQPA